MQEVATLETALNNTTRLIGGIGDDQWGSSTPCKKWEVRELVRHTVGVIANFAGGAAGTDAIGDPGELDLGDDPGATCAKVSAECVANWTARGELDSSITLGESELPGAVGININILDAYAHCWDMAEATGQDAQLDPTICGAVLSFAKPVVPEDPRVGDNFHAVVAVAESASAQDKLMGCLGRQPT